MSAGASGARGGASNKRFVFVAAAISAMGGLLFGYDTGIISGALLFIKKDFGLSDNLQQVVVGSLLLGAVFGALGGGTLSDNLGRRRSILLAALVFAVGSVLSALAPSTAVLVAARFVLGLAIGAAGMVVPVYIAEISPSSVRGRLVSLNQFLITVGILLAYGVNFAFSQAGAWRWMLGLGLVPAAALLIGMFFLPESPRWLVGKGRREQAHAVLERAEDPGTDIDARIREIEGQQIAEARAGYRELFTPRLRPALTVGVGTATVNQLVGVNAVIYYAPTLLSDAGFGASAAILATVGVGLTNVLLTLVALLMIDRLGRRPLLLTGTAGVTLSLIVLGAVYLLPSQSGVAGYVLIGALLVYIASFAASLGICIWLLNSEVYPLEVRGKGSAAGSITHWTLDLIVASTVLTLINTITATGTFWLYAAFGIIGLLFFYRIVPETKGRSLEDIEAELAERASIGSGSTQRTTS